MANFPIIDAHHHFWDIERNYHPWLRDEPMIPFRYGDYSSIRRNYLPEEYFADADGLEIVKTVYVETEWDPSDPVGESKYAQWLYETTGFPNAVVAQAWLDKPDAADVLAAHAQFPLSRSVRHKPRAASSLAEAVRGEPGSMDCERWREGFAALKPNGLFFDLQTPWWHLDAASELARDFPETLIVLNHAGLPADRSEHMLRKWADAIAAFAENPNTAIKISGIGLKDVVWSAENNRWIVRTCIETFGEDRAMFASNFPVDGVTGSFRTIYDGYLEIVSDMSDVAQRKLFHDNAERLYRPL